jgi:hypothetical protein
LRAIKIDTKKRVVTEFDYDENQAIAEVLDAPTATALQISEEEVLWLNEDAFSDRSNGLFDIDEVHTFGGDALILGDNAGKPADAVSDADEVARNIRFHYIDDENRFNEFLEKYGIDLEQHVGISKERACQLLGHINKEAQNDLLMQLESHTNVFDLVPHVKAFFETMQKQEDIFYLQFMANR